MRVTGESIPIDEGPEDGLTVLKLLVKEAARLPNDLIEAKAAQGKRSAGGIEAEEVTVGQLALDVSRSHVHKSTTNSNAITCIFQTAKVSPSNFSNVWKTGIWESPAISAKKLGLEAKDR